MAYAERVLSREEHHLAMSIRDLVPRSERLQVCQEICTMAESLRDRANQAVAESTCIGDNEATRKNVWKSLYFPRYRFFDAAIPMEGWAKFAEDTAHIPREVGTW